MTTVVPAGPVVTTLSDRARGGVGESVPRVDAIPKVTGTLEYASDLRSDGMLWGAALRSPHPSARILGVDVSAAASLPGVHAVLLAADLPGKRTFGLNFDDQPVLADSLVRHHGEPIAVVAADTPVIARKATALIAVDWRPLPAVTDMEAPPLHDFGNVLRHVHIVHGSPDEAAADVWVEGYYATGMQARRRSGQRPGWPCPRATGAWTCSWRRNGCTWTASRSPPTGRLSSPMT
jgi:CO/xanthine dehydrogenase Mo-binding subunit